MDDPPDVDTSAHARLRADSPLVALMAELLGEPVADVEVWLEREATVIPIDRARATTETQGWLLTVRGRRQTAARELLLEAVVAGMQLGIDVERNGTAL